MTNSAPLQPALTTASTDHLAAVIDGAWEDRAKLSPAQAPTDIRTAVEQVIDALDRGSLRVAEKMNGDWVTHQWIKKAVLLSFRLKDNVPVQAGGLQFFD